MGWAADWVMIVWACGVCGLLGCGGFGVGLWVREVGKEGRGLVRAVKGRNELRRLEELMSMLAVL